MEIKTEPNQKRTEWAREITDKAPILTGREKAEHTLAVTFSKDSTGNLHGYAPIGVTLDGRKIKGIMSMSLELKPASPMVVKIESYATGLSYSGPCRLELESVQLPGTELDHE